MDDLAALALQLDWGVDEALLAHPIDRLSRAPVTPAPVAPTTIPVAPVPLVRTTNKAAASAATIAASCENLPALIAALAAYEGCALAATATSLAFAEGPPDARLVIVGDVAADAEDRAGRPFVGPAGQLLDRMIVSVGLDRAALGLVNAVPWRPPGNRRPSDGEIAACLPFLQRYIALVRPTWLVLLGALPTEALTGQRVDQRRQRGKWLEIRVPGVEMPFPALPMRHPNYLLCSPAAKRDGWTDWLTLRSTITENLTRS